MNSFQPLVRVLPYLGIRRILNSFNLYLSFCLSRVFKKPIVLGTPLSLSIEPTTACNLACPECPSGLKQFSRPVGKINLDDHNNWLNQLSPTVFYINYYFQGEPFIHPQFLQLIAAAKKNRIFTATSTNAHFINKDNSIEIVKSGLDQLILSVDGVTQEVYNQYRVNGDLEKVWIAAKALVEAKKLMKSKTPHLIFQCLAVRPNEHEIPEVFKKANELGIDEVRIKTAQLYDFKNGNPLMPRNEEYNRYRKLKDGTFALKNPGGNHCWRMWSSSVITWDGKVVPCCFDKDASHAMGELKNQSFKKVWKSPQYQKFRRNLLNQRDQIDICSNCSEGSKVWV